MNDMSFPLCDGVDEFGGVAHLVLPGQDPEILQRVHATFTAELEPKNLIERAWVRDLAILFARIEYLRIAICAVQNQLQAEEGTDGDQVRARERIGKAFVAEFALIEGLIRLELEVMRERDRVYQQYDHRTGVVRALYDAQDMIRSLQADAA